MQVRNMPFAAINQLLDILLQTCDVFDLTVRGVKPASK